MIKYKRNLAESADVKGGAIRNACLKPVFINNIDCQTIT